MQLVPRQASSCHLQSDCTQARAECLAVQELPFVQQLQPRMAAAAQKLGVLLAEALQVGVPGQPKQLQPDVPLSC